jgi:hypothetical protein
MEIVVFKSYSNDCYIFTFDNGSDFIFEEIHQKVLSKFDLRNDTSLIGKEFEIRFSEEYDNVDQDIVIYRIHSLKLI